MFQTEAGHDYVEKLKQIKRPPGRSSRQLIGFQFAAAK